MISEQRNGYTFVDRRGSAGGSQPGRSGPKAGFGLYPTPRYAGWDNYRPRPYITQGTKRGLSPFDRWELLNYSRQLFTQLGNLSSAIIQKNNWSVGDGWDPVFCGKNESWGQETGAWLRESWYPICDARGEPYDFKTSLFLSGMSWDIDGDDLMVLTESQSGFPMLRFIPSHLIGTRETEPEVKGGPFDGARIYDGVIMNRDGRPIGYRVQTEDDEEYKDISAFNAQMLYEPHWKDQGRGIPRPAAAILDWFDVQDIDVFLKRGVKMDASQGIMHWTESGEAEDGAATITASEMMIQGVPQNDLRTDPVVTNRGLQMEPINGGEFMYMRAKSGEKIEAFNSERPHPNTEAFIQRLERRGLHAVGWFYELLDLTQIGGVAARLLKDLAMQTIQMRQRTLKRRALRAIRYAIGKGMKNGFIPKYYDDSGDAFQWDFEMPGEISVDTGNDEAADRENLKLGTSNMAIICAKKGLGNYEKVRRQTFKEIINLDQNCADVEKRTQGRIKYDKALELFTQRTPNGTPMAEMSDLPGAGGEEPGSQPKEEKKKK